MRPALLEKAWLHEGKLQRIFLGLMVRCGIFLRQLGNSEREKIMFIDRSK
jgi:hypothetical protein